MPGQPGGEVISSLATDLCQNIPLHSFCVESQITKLDLFSLQALLLGSVLV